MAKPVVLLVLDGWGIAPPGPGNAISLAKLRYIPRYSISYPHTQLVASGMGVGLPDGEDGNTETGHMNLGAGHIVYQDFPRINMAIAEGSFYQNPAFKGAVANTLEQNSNLHLIGLISDASVHAHRDHLFAILEFLSRQDKKPQVYLHLITDGRDSPPQSGLRFVAEVSQKVKNLGVGQIATVLGRYYAMDRDTRWERTEVAYKALTDTDSQKATSAEAAIESSYKDGKTDEFIDPTIILDDKGVPLSRIADKDSVIFYNYRIDRPRQLTRAFVLPDFETRRQAGSFDPYAIKYFHKHVVQQDDRGRRFTRKVKLNNLYFVTMTEYERNLPSVVAFPPQPVRMPLGRVFSDLGLRQLRMAETEKERFVTYYFNGLREDPLPGEDHLIVPSAKVATYDLKPEMSAYELTDKLIERLSLGDYSFFLVNIANVDMVAHTGSIRAAVRACEVVDECVGKIVEHVLAVDGTCIITADHGNVEEMLGASGEVDTEHSTFPVPFIFINKAFSGYPQQLSMGKLSDVATTILAFLNMQIPSDMTGKNLLADIMSQRR